MSALDADVRARCEDGRTIEALTIAVERHGPEIHAFLLRLTDETGAAQDAYAQFVEDVWRGLPRFEWRSSLRTWLYRLARHALHRELTRGPHRKAKVVPISQAMENETLAALVRSTTQPHLRSDNKAVLRTIVADLSGVDRALLLLRLDRNLSWPEIARVLADDADIDATEQRREEARLRKRYQRLKEMLRDRFEDAGLLAER